MALVIDTINLYLKHSFPPAGAKDKNVISL
jgi:hypothetical protein